MTKLTLRKGDTYQTLAGENKIKAFGAGYNAVICDCYEYNCETDEMELVESNVSKTKSDIKSDLREATGELYNIFFSEEEEEILYRLTNIIFSCIII